MSYTGGDALRDLHDTDERVMYDRMREHGWACYRVADIDALVATATMLWPSLLTDEPGALVPPPLALAVDHWRKDRVEWLP